MKRFCLDHENVCSAIAEWLCRQNDLFGRWHVSVEVFIVESEYPDCRDLQAICEVSEIEKDFPIDEKTEGW